jgi:PAS domain S-box-containing protein
MSDQALPNVQDPVRLMPDLEAIDVASSQMAASLRERERELEEAHRIARLGTWHWVIETDTVTWTEEVYRTFDRDLRLPAPTYEELKSTHAPESWEKISAAVARAMTTGEPYKLDVELILPSGDRRWILARGKVASRSADGKVTELRGTIQDIHERKLNEERVARSEARYRSLVQASSDLMWVTDAEGNQQSDLPGWQAFTGQTDAEVLGFGWADAIHPDDRAATMDAWNAAMATGRNFEVQQRLRRRDGVYRTMLAKAVPSRDANGKVLEWVGMHTDITDRIQAEDALRRTEKLAATGRLAASIAHEINNPLEAVTNSLYLALLDEKLDEETRYYLKTAETELQRVARLTTQMLRFHRQSRQAKLAAMGALMDSALELFAGRMAATAIEVEREYRTDVQILCRGDELRQVFANLVSNAMDATPTGGRLRVRIAKSHAWNAERTAGVRVTFADNGTGIPAELQGQIFEPFMTTKASSGTGLGLWVSAGIVQKHRGRFSLRSKVGQGTVFSVWFPLGTES